VIVATLCCGCGSTLRLADLPPGKQAPNLGTEPGRHEISPWFAVEVRKGGMIDAARARFYFHPDSGRANGERTLGEQYVYWPTGELVTDKREFGPRACAFAVSADGRSLLYFVEPRVYLAGRGQDWHPKPFGAELHLFRAGAGDSLVAADVDHAVSWDLSAVPADGVVYWEADRRGHHLRTLWERGERVVRTCGEFAPAPPAAAH
jgi:hypothetical protein